MPGRLYISSEAYWYGIGFHGNGTYSALTHKGIEPLRLQLSQSAMVGHSNVPQTFFRGGLEGEMLPRW